jgi:hypothetical protein
MKKLTIIDSYDYVVELIERIADILNRSLSRFGKYSVSNDEICNIIIKEMSNRIKDEAKDSFKPITNGLLIKKADNVKNRKLAIEMDEDLISSVNNAISIILANGYKKIPSRTMFFRESLRVFFEILYTTEKRPAMNIIEFLSISFFDKLFGTTILCGEDTSIVPRRFIPVVYSTFIDKLYENPIVYKFILERRGEIKILSDPEAITKKEWLSEEDKRKYFIRAFTIDEDCKIIEKNIIPILKEDEKENGRVKFTLPYEDGTIWIEMPKYNLNSLISAIAESYREIGDKVKFFLLISFIEKEIFRSLKNILDTKGQFHPGDIIPYDRNRILDLSDIYIISDEFDFIEGGNFSINEKTELTNILMDIANLKIKEVVSPKTKLFDIILMNYLSRRPIPYVSDRKKSLKITYE